jgi:tRNA-specific 2-thiouridylase
MSGGVDSSVAAAILRRDGYDVVGCFMRLGNPGESIEAPPSVGACAAPAGSARSDGTSLRIRHRGCCSVSDAADARAVAAELGIPFYVCNFKRDFGRVIDYFVDEYAAGRTPNPCVRCNDWLKFGRLHEYARQVGAEFVASGHYARLRPAGSADGASAGGVESRAPARVRPAGEGGFRLLRAMDRAKDQSYVLFGLPREQLSRTLLPVGEYHKADVRDLARRFGLPVFDKPDSQEICFVPDDDYAALVEERRPRVTVSGGAPEGRIVDVHGRTIGRHDGQHRYTIGQRRGVGVAAGAGLFVLDKDASANTITVGPRERLLVDGCLAGEANWLVDPGELGADPDGWFPCRARHRYNAEAVSARARVLPDAERPGPSGRSGRFEVRFDQPQVAVAPGQAIVLYDADGGDVVLGGGWIESAARR